MATEGQGKVLVLKLRSKRIGNHIEEQVFGGVDEDHLQLLGTLMMDIGQWQLFGAALLFAADNTSIGRDLKVITEGDDEVVEGIK